MKTDIMWRCLIDLILWADDKQVQTAYCFLLKFLKRTEVRG